MKIKIFFAITIMFTSFGIRIYSTTLLNDNDEKFLQMLDELLQTENTYSYNPQTLIKNQQKNTSSNPIFKKKIKEISKQKTKNFLKYIDKYFPRIFVIQEKFFSTITPEDLAKVLKQIIDIIAYRPWLYLEQLFKPIMNKLELEKQQKWRKNNFDIQFLIKIFKNKNLKKLPSQHPFENFIADQLANFHKFLKFAKVDIKNNLVFCDQTINLYDFFLREKNNNYNNEISLIKYWTDKGESVVFDFYELCADYWSRLFIKSIQSEQLNKAYKYYDDLKKILNNLKNTPNEAKLNEYIQKYKNLLKLLKQKNNSLYEKKEKDKSFYKQLKYWDT